MNASLLMSALTADATPTDWGWVSCGPRTVSVRHSRWPQLSHLLARGIPSIVLMLVSMVVALTPVGLGLAGHGLSFAMHVQVAAAACWVLGVALWVVPVLRATTEPRTGHLGRAVRHFLDTGDDSWLLGESSPRTAVHGPAVETLNSGVETMPMPEPDPGWFRDEGPRHGVTVPDDDEPDVRPTRAQRFDLSDLDDDDEDPIIPRRGS